jgi:uncharacterized membrane protein HdeD (DUF308 family)
VPLLVTGAAVTVVIARDLLVTIHDDRMPAGGAAGPGIIASWPVSAICWLLMPAAFVAVWLSRRHLRAGRGVGDTLPSATAAAAVAGLVFGPPLAILALISGPFLAFGVGLVIIGVAERTRPIWVWGLAAGVFGVIEGLYWITNRLPAGLWSPEAHDVILLVPAVLTVVAGAVAWRRENQVLTVA